MIQSVSPLTGTKFTYIPGGGRYVHFKGLGLAWAKDKEMPAGVIIETAGVKIFRPNAYYEHIEPLEPTEKEKLTMNW